MTEETTLVLGGARSGKSRMAESLVTALPGPWTYIATARPLDGEMAARIAHHRAGRSPGWVTVEEPLDLPGALSAAGDTGRPVLVDCLTLWLTNIILDGRDVPAGCRRLLETISRLPVPVVLVANEVGLGIVPDNALARLFRDHAGRLNQDVAAIARRVLFMAAGLPLTLKDLS